MPESNVPAPLPRTLDRAALERVLARAAELQASSAEPGELMTEAQLLELGTDVGIDAHYLKQALAEEQTRTVLPEDPSGTASMFGPGRASATRAVRGTPPAVLAGIDRWMQNEECLQVRRRFADRMTWEPRRDFFGSIRRSFNVGGRGYALSSAQEVAATVVALDDKRAFVRLDADLAPTRRARVKESVASAVTGVTAGGVAAGLFAFLVPITGPAAIAMGLLAAVPAALGAGGALAIARAQRRAVVRAQLALEQLLDQLEHGGPRRGPTLIDVLSEAVRLPR